MPESKFNQQSYNDNNRYQAGNIHVTNLYFDRSHLCDSYQVMPPQLKI